MKLNLRQLRYFCEVVDSRTLSGAAERLFVAPTAISMQIAQLEQSLGGELFDRAVKPMVLTALGRFFLPRARELLAVQQKLEREAREMATGHGGWLGIGFVRSLMNSILPGAVRAFRCKHPEVKIDLIELLSEHQPAHLRSGRIHIGLSRYARLPEVPSDLRHTRLFEDPFVVAISAQHRLAKRKKICISDLSDLPLISYPKDPQSTFAQNVLSLLEAAGMQPRIGHEAIEIHTALGLVAADLGYAVVGASVAERGQNDIAFVDVPELKARTTVLTVTRVDEGSDLVSSMLETLASLSPDKSGVRKRQTL